MSHVDAIVPCGSCTECCRRTGVELRREDNPDLYETAMKDGKLYLAHKRNRDCLYLSRKRGCTIYEKRPMVCRIHDCADWYLGDGRWLPGVTRTQRRAARKRMKREGGQSHHDEQG